ncbi:pyocin activator PrtN family protein [Shewanella sp. 10N.286.51.B8]|uniref:pyocin activator PrtN family protein n=1 Tax=Shewanella sp. 10N.286.51.B8 TaxID=3229708 RepID=UPI00354DAAC8
MNQLTQLSTQLSESLQLSDVSIKFVAKQYFGVGEATFKKRLKTDEFLKSLKIDIKKGRITIDALANMFMHYRSLTIKRLQINNNAFDSSSCDKQPSYEGSAMSQALMSQYGAPLVPYLEVAKTLFGWAASGTAMTRFRDGTIDNTPLVTICLAEGNKDALFVYVDDLVKCINHPRFVNISKR